LGQSTQNKYYINVFLSLPRKDDLVEQEVFLVREKGQKHDVYNRQGETLIWIHNSLNQLRVREKEKLIGEKKKIIFPLGFILSCFGIELGKEIHTK